MHHIKHKSYLAILVQKLEYQNQVTGVYDSGVKNQRGQRLIQFAVEHTNTLFKKKPQTKVEKQEMK